jgi:hypothetical protein
MEQMRALKAYICNDEHNQFSRLVTVSTMVNYGRYLTDVWQYHKPFQVITKTRNMMGFIGKKMTNCC